MHKCSGRLWAFGTFSDAAAADNGSRLPHVRFVYPPQEGEGRQQPDQPQLGQIPIFIPHINSIPEFIRPALGRRRQESSIEDEAALVPKTSASGMVGKKRRQTLEFHGDGLLDRTRYSLASCDPTDIRGINVELAGDPAEQPTANCMRPGSVHPFPVIVQLHPVSIVDLCPASMLCRIAHLNENQALGTTRRRATGLFLFEHLWNSEGVN